MLISFTVRAPRELDCGQIHIEKWDEVEDDRDIYEQLVGAGGRLVELPEQQHHSRTYALDKNCDVRGAPTAVNLAQRPSDIAVHSNPQSAPRNTLHLPHHTP